MALRDDTNFNSGTRTDMSVMARLLTGVTAGIKGASQAWFGPMQPLVPVASPAPEAQVVGRRFDYQTGYNLDQRPRGYEPVSFPDLRALSRNCDVLRLVIETRKDQIAGLDWNVRVKALPGEDKRRIKATPDQKNRINKITDFLQSPDKELDFDQWMRAFLEDHFVIDAPVIYRRPDRKGGLYALELIDGSTISPKLTGTGRRPLPPEVAYQQVLKGVPAVDYTSDELYYCARNVSTNHVYGYSPVEQVLLTANIAIRRATFQLEYYTKGSQPDAFLGLPETWTIDQIKVFQDWLDSLKSQRRLLRAVPGKPAYVPTKEPVLKDDYDDYLNRLICFAFSVAPTALVKMMNRAQSESQHDQALEEGNGPTMKFIISVMNKIVRNDFQSPDLEFEFIDDAHVDPEVQSQINDRDLKNGSKTIDEVREGRGEDPLGGAASVPMVLTPTGYVAIGANIPNAMGGDMEDITAAKPPPPMLQHLGPDGQPLPPQNDDGKTPALPAPANDTKDDKEPVAAKKLAKVHKAGYRYNAPASAKRKTLAAAKKQLTARIATLLAEVGSHVGKQLNHLTKAEDDRAAQIQRAIDALDLTTITLVASSTMEDIETVAREAGTEALARVGVELNNELVNQVFEEAVTYAKDRAAYLVGKKILDDGSIVDAENEYSIDDATREALRSTVTDYLSEAKPANELADAIKDSFAFSEERAQLIAHTEVANANSAGSLNGYRAAAAAGVEVLKSWSVTDDECCDECEENEAVGPIPLDDEFPSGDDAPLAHPNCRCVLLSVQPDEKEETNE